MDELRSKVLRAIFASPASVIPIVGGATALLVSWAMGGSLLLNVGGASGLAAGVGLMGYRLSYGLEELTAKVFSQLNEMRRQEREDALDSLERQLRGDRDPRTQTYLRRLRKLYADFQEDLQQGKVSRSARTVLGDVENLFKTAVKHLEQSYHLWDTASQMAGDPKHSMLDAREQVVEEVHISVEHLSRTIEQFHSFRVRESEDELSKLRQELDVTMQAARRAEERVDAIGRAIDYRTAKLE